MTSLGSRLCVGSLSSLSAARSGQPRGGGFVAWAWPCMRGHARGHARTSTQRLGAAPRSVLTSMCVYTFFCITMPRHCCCIAHDAAGANPEHASRRCDAWRSMTLRARDAPQRDRAPPRQVSGRSIKWWQPLQEGLCNWRIGSHGPTHVWRQLDLPTRPGNDAHGQQLPGCIANPADLGIPAAGACAPC